MRGRISLPGTFGLLLLFASAITAAEPTLTLSDPKLPLQELRPLDRHVWVLSLDGTWKQPALPGVAYHVNLLFPNGQSYSHRVLDDAAFRRGEVQCLIPDYQLLRNGLAPGGKFAIVISHRHGVDSALTPEVMSAPLELQWPLNRPVFRFAPRTRFSPADPIDGLRPPNEALPSPAQETKKVPAKESPSVPK